TLAVTPAFAQPTITRRSIVNLGATATATDQNSATFTITGMSGITYRPTPAGGECIVVMDNSDQLVRLHIPLNADRTIEPGGVAILGGLTLSVNSDHEGIAFIDNAHNSVFVTSEVGPDISEFSLSTGALIQSLAVPAVFTTPGNLRSNFGFESLTRSPVT